MVLIEEFSEAELATKSEKGVQYGSYKHVAPFSFDQVSLLIKLVEPQLVLSEASKTVHVSHWGFISIDEYFLLENIGAELKGEFNRYDFSKKGNG